MCPARGRRTRSPPRRSPGSDAAPEQGGRDQHRAERRAPSPTPLGRHAATTLPGGRSRVLRRARGRGRRGRARGRRSAAVAGLAVRGALLSLAAGRGATDPCLSPPVLAGRALREPIARVAGGHVGRRGRRREQRRDDERQHPSARVAEHQLPWRKTGLETAKGRRPGWSGARSPCPLAWKTTKLRGFCGSKLTST